jgi:hypothetical protein
VSSDAGIVESLESCVGLDLNELSWNELSSISSDLSSKDEASDSPYYQAVEYMMENSHTKTFETSSAGIGEKVSVRIIGICQDQKSDNTGSAGLTFQTVHVLAQAYPMREDGEECSWESSDLRSLLNSTIYSNLPSDLRDNIVSVKKYYSTDVSDQNATSVDTYTDDYLFVLSGQEQLNIYNRWSLLKKYGTLEQEGTGKDHNEPYQAYNMTNDEFSRSGKLAALFFVYGTTDFETAFSNCSEYLAKDYYDADHSINGSGVVWLRSKDWSYKTNFLSIMGNTGFNYGQVGEKLLTEVAPAFCL